MSISTHSRIFISYAHRDGGDVAVRLQPIAEPAIRNPPLDLVVVHTQAFLQVAHGVPDRAPAGEHPSILSSLDVAIHFAHYNLCRVDTTTRRSAEAKADQDYNIILKQQGTSGSYRGARLRIGLLPEWMGKTTYSLRPCRQLVAFRRRLPLPKSVVERHRL